MFDRVNKVSGLQQLKSNFCRRFSNQLTKAITIMRFWSSAWV